MNMYDKMKEKGIPATSYKKSNEIVKTISKAENVELFRQLESVFAQNKREYNDGLKTIERDLYYNGEQITIDRLSNKKQQKLIKKYR